MDHKQIYPEDLAPGYGLTPETLEGIHAKVTAAFAQYREHAQTLASLPWAGPRLLESARAFVQASAVPLYDFDLAFNYWNWIYQFELYGHDHALSWDRLEQAFYPRFEAPDISQFCQDQGLAFIENADQVLARWQPLIPALLDQLERTGVRILCNHATWMTQGILIVLFHHAIQAYCTAHPTERARVEALGLGDHMALGRQVHTLLGPWITTLGHRLNAEVSELNALQGIQAISNVIKVFPDTPSGRFDCCYGRWKAAVRQTLRLLKQLETTPGKLIFETPSGQQDGQTQGQLTPGPMARAAIRLSRARPNQVILIGMDEREVFDRGLREGGFVGGQMQHGRIGLAMASYLAPRPQDSGPDWPFDDWQDVCPAITALIENAEGQKIGVQDTGAWDADAQDIDA